MSDSPDRSSTLVRVNLWLAARVWIPLAVLITGVLMLGFALLVVTARVSTLAGKVADSSAKLSELQYRSCIEDAVLEFNIAEGELVDAAFARDPDRVAAGEESYREALDSLHGAQDACRVKFPD